MSDNLEAKQRNDRTRRPALKLEKFVKRSKLSKFDHFAKKKQKFESNARLLREYKKSLKQEGFDASINTRKRVKRSQTEDSNDDGQKQAESLIGDENYRRKKFKKSDPLFEAKKKAEEMKKKRAEDRASYEQNLKQKEQKLKERKQKSRKMKQKTRKGQPVMKNVISNMLEKLQKETFSSEGR